VSDLMNHVTDQLYDVRHEYNPKTDQPRWPFIVKADGSCIALVEEEDAK